MSNFHNHHSATLKRSASAHQLSAHSCIVKVYVDSATQTRKHQLPRAAYGIFVPYHSLRIAEPVPGSDQSTHRAQLRAFHASLELVHGIRARAAIICLSSTYVFDSFTNHLHQWRQNDWRIQSGHVIPHRRLWQDIALLQVLFADRGVSLHVQKRNTSHNMRVAKRLASHALSLHVQCDLCHKLHGRQFQRHGCEPLCNFDYCHNRKHDNIDQYWHHIRRYHRRFCGRSDCGEKFECFNDEEMDEHVAECHPKRPYSCDFCFKTYQQRRRAKEHMRHRCKYASLCTYCGLRFHSASHKRRHFHHMPHHMLSDDKQAMERFDEESHQHRDDESVESEHDAKLQDIDEMLTQVEVGVSRPGEVRLYSDSQNQWPRGDALHEHLDDLDDDFEDLQYFWH